MNNKPQAEASVPSSSAFSRYLINLGRQLKGLEPLSTKPRASSGDLKTKTVAKKFKKWEIVKYSILLLLFLLYIIVSTIDPSDNLRYVLSWYIWLPLTTYIVFFEGFRYFRVYYKLYKRSIDMYTLIGIASHVIFIYALVFSILYPLNGGVDERLPHLWELPGLIITVAVVGERIEEGIRRDTSEAFEAIYKMKKNSVVIRDGDLTRAVTIENLKIGDVMVVSKGQMVSVDGTAVSDGEFDYSNITGESISKTILQGQEVTSGSYNIGRAIDIIVSKPPQESTIFKIVDSLVEAAGNKPKLQKLADTILKRFVYVVCIMAVLALIVWSTVGALDAAHSVPWLDYMIGNANPSLISGALGVLAFVMVLAVACPEALGIAMPIILLVSATSLQRNGIVINKPYAVQGLQTVKIVAFDKTGTITTDQLVISRINGDARASAIAKSLEHNIPHPIAKAFERLDVPLVDIDDLQHLDSHGIEGVFEGKKYVVKGESLAEYHDPASTIIGLREEGELIATFELRNEIKAGAREVIADLKRNHIKTVMLTGDAEHVAKWVAEQVGIDEYRASLKPNDKHIIINDLRKRGRVLFVGDGFNDSLASQAADISVAFASGSDIVNNISDFSIASNDFRAINLLMLTGRLNNIYARWSITWALMFNFLALPLAVLLLVPPFLSAVLLAVSDLMIVVTVLSYRYHLNKTTTRRMKKLRAAAPEAASEPLTKD